MKTIYLGLGSNVGDREQMLQSAIDRLQARDLSIKRFSSVWETEPVDVRNQREFLNMVIEAETGLFPMMLLSRIQKVEMSLGRRRTGPAGAPRSIDVDILLYGGFTVRSAKLEIPHPRMHERRFVLAPLAELAPDLRHPVLRRTIRELLSSIEAQKAHRTQITLRPPEAQRT